MNLKPAFVLASLITATALAALTTKPSAPDIPHAVRRDMPRDPALPTLWLVGDSTVRTGQGHGELDQWGWGDYISPYFDTTKINVVNRALGGRSSRTYIAEGHWAAVLHDAKKGDFVLLQMGHNDSSPINDKSRARGTIRGTGNESEEIDNQLTGKHETVYTYGHYLRQYITDAHDHGLTIEICSPIPRLPKDPVTSESYDKTTYSLWAEQVADQEHVPFIPLNRIITTHYAGQKSADLKTEYFTVHDNTHTNIHGAKLNAQSVVEGIKSDPHNPLLPYLSQKAADLPVVNFDTTHASTK